VETTDGDISAYIPTNLISITDGQIYLDTGRFERDLRPAIDIGRSVSRIGAVAQPKPMRKVAKNLKIILSRFESLEKLSRVGLDIDLATQRSLQEGYILRALLRQTRLTPRSIAQQVIVLTATGEHWLSELQPSKAVAAADALFRLAEEKRPEWVASLNSGEFPQGDWVGEMKTWMAGVSERFIESGTTKS
jgi:F-type H+-transporting ATPase subunit alpha